MKKRLICMLLATALAVSLAVIPVAAENSAENERYIYTYLTTEMGLNTAAACGIDYSAFSTMANTVNTVTTAE